MKLVHYLVSTNLSKRTGVFRYRNEKSPVWVEVNVTLSPILWWRIANKADNPREKLPVSIPYRKHAFTSKINGGSYQDSPFNLCLFKPDDGVDGSMNYRLEAVDEPISKAIHDEVTGDVLGYEDTPKFNWIRYTVNKYQKLFTGPTVDPAIRMVKVV